MPTVKPQPTPTPSIMDQTFAHKTVPGATTQPVPVTYYIEIPDDVMYISVFESVSDAKIWRWIHFLNSLPVQSQRNWTPLLPLFN